MFAALADLPRRAGCCGRSPHRGDGRRRRRRRGWPRPGDRARGAGDRRPAGAAARCPSTGTSCATGSAPASPRLEEPTSRTAAPIAGRPDDPGALRAAAAIALAAVIAFWPARRRARRRLVAAGAPRGHLRGRDQPRPPGRRPAPGRAAARRSRSTGSGSRDCGGARRAQALGADRRRRGRRAADRRAAGRRRPLLNYESLGHLRHRRRRHASTGTTTTARSTGRATGDAARRSTARSRSTGRRASSTASTASPGSGRAPDDPLAVVERQARYRTPAGVLRGPPPGVDHAGALPGPRALEPVRDRDRHDRRDPRAAGPESQRGRHAHQPRRAADQRHRVLGRRRTSRSRRRRSCATRRRATRSAGSAPRPLHRAAERASPPDTGSRCRSGAIPTRRRSTACSRRRTPRPTASRSNGPPNAHTPYAAIRAIENHLRRDYAYDPNVLSHTYPLESFLFDDRAGYCQQFSGAMGLMLRMLGIPAASSPASRPAPGTRTTGPSRCATSTPTRGSRPTSAASAGSRSTRPRPPRRPARRACTVSWPAPAGRHRSPRRSSRATRTAARTEPLRPRSRRARAADRSGRGSALRPRSP